MERAMRAVSLMIAAVGLAACAGAAGADGKITISKAVWADFQTYRSAMTSTGIGVYAVTPDGQGGAGASCAQSRCTGMQDAREKAVGQCQTLNPGDKCVVFAESREIVVPYEIAQ